MGDWDTCISRCGNRRRDTRNYLEWNAGFNESNRFFSTASKDIRVAAFEANNDFAGFGVFNQQTIKFILACRSDSRIGCLDLFGVCGAMFQQGIV